MSVTKSRGARQRPLQIARIVLAVAAVLVLAAIAFVAGVAIAQSGQ